MRAQDSETVYLRLLQHQPPPAADSQEQGNSGSSKQATAGTTSNQATAGTTSNQATAGTTSNQATAGTTSNQATKGTGSKRPSGAGTKQTGITAYMPPKKDSEDTVVLRPYGQDWGAYDDTYGYGLSAPSSEFVRTFIIRTGKERQVLQVSMKLLGRTAS
jgi:hypothetical protein